MRIIEMRLHTFYSVILCCLVLPWMGQALCAQEIQVLSLDSCLKAAQAHNATIQSSKLDIEAADYVRREVMAKFFPVEEKLNT